MIKELAKTIVKDRRMNSAIESAEKYADYLVALYQTNLLKQLTNLQENINKYPAYESKAFLKLSKELRIIKDEYSRDFLIEECRKLILMNSLEEIL